MAALVTPTADYDSPWKEALFYYFEDFLRLLAPWLHDQIDWSHPPVFLDKELQALNRDRRNGRRHVDMLVQVMSKSQEPFVVVIHVEIQGGRVNFLKFGKRMFGYAFRLHERYATGFKTPDGALRKMRLVSLAVLTASSRQEPTAKYAWDTLGPGYMDFSFPIVHLKAWLNRWDELKKEAAANPFAIIIMAQLQAQETAKDSDQRLVSKTQVMRLMYRYGYSKNNVAQLFRIIDWMMDLPEELEPAFEQEMLSIEQENEMAFVTSIERLGEKRGLEKGITIGLERGLDKGKLEGESGLLQRQLIRKFGPLSETLQQRIQAATPNQLETWSLNILDAQTLEEVFAE